MVVLVLVARSAVAPLQVVLSPAVWVSPSAVAQLLIAVGDKPPVLAATPQVVELEVREVVLWGWNWW